MVLLMKTIIIFSILLFLNITYGNDKSFNNEKLNQLALYDQNDINIFNNTKSNFNKSFYDNNIIPQEQSNNSNKTLPNKKNYFNYCKIFSLSTDFNFFLNLDKIDQYPSGVGFKYNLTENYNLFYKNELTLHKIILKVDNNFKSKNIIYLHSLQLYHYLKNNQYGLIIDSRF